MSVSSNLIENQINKGILKLKEDWNLKMEKDSELIDLVTKELLINSGGLRQDGQDLSVNLPKFFAADQTWLELQMRIGYSENPQNPLIPQTSVYLPGICTGELAPKHPFGVPSYHYYTCPSNRGTISRKSTYDYVLCPKYHGHRPKVQISNAKVTLEPFGAFPAMELWSFGENAIYSTPDQHCSARFNASKLVLSNGRLIDELGGKEVKIVMNNQFELKEKIQKIAFSVKTNFVEVLMLLENFTMASGCVFENMRKNKLNVSIFEMPGTYGTTDFQCSPDFKSMVRVSQMERKIRKMSKIEEKIEYNSECIRHILKRVMQLYEAQNWNQMHSMEWFKLACQFCQCTVTAGKRLSNPDERTEIPDYLTPREKIVNLSTVETEECGHREPCLNAWDLIAIGRRIAEGKFEVCWGDDKAELLAEYSHQVLIALYGLADLFGNHKTMNGRDKRSKIASLNLYQFYSMSVKHLISCFEISALAVRVIILDIACLKATPSQYAQILELYPVAPKLVARVVRKYPQLIFFGNSPIFPPIRLIRLAGYMLNRTISEFEKSREKEIELVDLTMDTEDVEDLDVIFIKNVKASEVIRQAPEEVTEAIEPEVNVEASEEASDAVMEQDDAVEASEDITDSEVTHVEDVDAPEVVEQEKSVENLEEAASEDVPSSSSLLVAILEGNLKFPELDKSKSDPNFIILSDEDVRRVRRFQNSRLQESQRLSEDVGAQKSDSEEPEDVVMAEPPESQSSEFAFSHPEDVSRLAEASEDIQQKIRHPDADSPVLEFAFSPPEDVTAESPEVLSPEAPEAASEDVTRKLDASEESPLREFAFAAPEDVTTEFEASEARIPEDVVSEFLKDVHIAKTPKAKIPEDVTPKFSFARPEELPESPTRGLPLPPRFSMKYKFAKPQELEDVEILEVVEILEASEGPEDVISASSTSRAPGDVDIEECEEPEDVRSESSETKNSEEPIATETDSEDVIIESTSSEDVTPIVQDATNTVDMAPEAPELESTESPTTSNAKDAEVVILEESSEDDEVSEYSPEFNYAAEYVDSEDVMPESSTNDTYEIAARGDSEDVTADAQEAIESDGDLESENPEARESPEVATSSKAPESKNPELQDPEDVMPQTSKFQDSQKSENPEDVAPEDAPESATSSEAPESKNPEDVAPEGSSKSPIRFSFPEHPSTSRTTPDSEATKIPLLSPGGRKPYTQVIAELVGDDDFEIPPGVSPYRNTLEGQKRMREKRVADEPTTSSRPPKTSRKKILEDVTPRKRHPLFSKSTIPKFRGDYDITTEFTKEANKKKGEEGAVADRTRRKKASTQDRIQKVMKIGQKKRGK